MEPIRPRARRTQMRSIALTCAALVLPLSLAACGSDDSGDDDVASDPAPTSQSSTAAPTEEPSPTEAPTTGTYPEFEPSDYTYELTVQCFCVDANEPVTVTVEGGAVVSAVYAEGAGQGTDGRITPGDPAGEGAQLTINDVIEKANDTEADEVVVDWPEGQDYPSKVSIDRAKGATDDEVVYLLADVQVA